jgi:hypothetical protein
MTRMLFVVSCNNPLMFDMVQHRLDGNADAEVTLDRRFRERRRRDDQTPIERRQNDRRRDDIDSELTTLGWALIRRR